MAGDKLPGGPQELTAEWLTGSLRETDTISGGTSVVSFETETIGEGVGLIRVAMGVLFFLITSVMRASWMVWHR